MGIRVLFEDKDTSSLVSLYRSFYQGVEVVGVSGADNLIPALDSNITLAYVDIAYDNYLTIKTFNALVTAPYPVLPVPIPNLEYMYLLLCKQYGQVVDSSVVEAALGVTNYKAHNKFGARNFENFCKATAKNSLTGCAKLRANVETAPRFLRQDCPCTTRLVSCTAALVCEKTYQFIMSFPLKVAAQGLHRLSQEGAITTVNHIIDRWNRIVVSDTLLEHVPYDKLHSTR